MTAESLAVAELQKANCCMMQTFRWGSDAESIERDLLVGALKDGRLLEGVRLLLLHDAPLSEGGVEDSLAEIEPSSHLNLFTPS